MVSKKANTFVNSQLDTVANSARESRTQLVNELYSNYLGSNTIIRGLDSLEIEALPRFVDPQTNRRAEASKNKPIPQGSTLRGTAIASQSKQPVFICLDAQLAQFLNSPATALNNCCVLSYEVVSQPSFNLSNESLENQSAYLALELYPYLQKIAQGMLNIIVVGQQFNAVLAAYTAAHYANTIAGALSLSGSFYWKPQAEKKWEWLTQSFVETHNCPPHLYLLSSLVVRLEPPRNIPTARMANQNLYNVLKAKGCNVHLKEFSAQPLSTTFMAELQTGCEWLLQQLADSQS